MATKLYSLLAAFLILGSEKEGVKRPLSPIKKYSVVVKVDDEYLLEKDFLKTDTLNTIIQPPMCASCFE